MQLRVRAEAVVRRVTGDTVSPRTLVEPAGASAAHLVDPATGKTRCGQDAAGMYDVDAEWGELRPFYRCPACQVSRR